MHEPDRRAIILARVSTAEQAADGFSLDAQLRLLRDYASRRGLAVVAEHAIAESAAGKRERTLFNAVISALRTKGAPGHLIVEKSDRLTRNLGDTATIDALRLKGLQVHFVVQGWTLGPDAPPSELLAWDICAAVDRNFSRNLARESKKGQREKRAQGGWNHLAPLGLINRRAVGRRAWIEEDPATGPLVRQLFEAVATDALTTKAAAQLAHDIGLRGRQGARLSPGAIASLLRSPLLAGLVPLSGAWRGGRRAPAKVATEYRDAEWAPVVERATWQAVQDLLDARRKRLGVTAPAKGGTEPHAFAGLLECSSCGSRVTAEAHSGRRGRGRYVYYRCAQGSRSDCGRVYTREEVLVGQVAERLRALEIPEGTRELLRESLRRATAGERRERDAMVQAQRQAIDRAQRRIDGAVDLAAGGEIGLDELAAVRRRADEERARAEAKLAALASADRSWGEDVIRALGVLSAAAELYLEAGSGEKRQLVELLFGRRVLAGGRLELSFASPWSAVETAAGAETLKRASAENADTCGDESAIAPTGSGGGISPETLEAAMALRAAPEAIAALLRLAA